MASSVLRSAGGVLRRSIPQSRSPISDFLGRTQPTNKYSTSSSGALAKHLKKISVKNKVNEVQCELLDQKADVLAQVMGGLKKEFKELESAIEKKDAMARR